MGDHMDLAPWQLYEPGERRTAIAWVTAEAIAAVLLGLKNGRGLFPVFRDLPDDARPLRVAYDFERHAFGIVFESPAFAVVPDGYPAPWLELSCVGFREFVADPDAVVVKG